MSERKNEKVDTSEAAKVVNQLEIAAFCVLDPNEEGECAEQLAESIQQKLPVLRGAPATLYPAPPSTVKQLAPTWAAAKYLRKNTPADAPSIIDLMEAADHIEAHGRWPIGRAAEHEAKQLREDGR